MFHLIMWPPQQSNFNNHSSLPRPSPVCVALSQRGAQTPTTRVMCSAVTRKSRRTLAITAEGATTSSTSAMSTMEDIMWSESSAGDTSPQSGSVKIKGRLTLSLSICLASWVWWFVWCMSEKPITSHVCVHTLMYRYMCLHAPISHTPKTRMGHLTKSNNHGTSLQLAPL